MGLGPSNGTQTVKSGTTARSLFLVRMGKPATSLGLNTEVWAKVFVGDRKVTAKEGDPSQSASLRHCRGQGMLCDGNGRSGSRGFFGSRARA